MVFDREFMETVVKRMDSNDLQALHLRRGATPTMDVSGTSNGANQVDLAASPELVVLASGATASADIDAIGRNTAAGNAFSHFDLHLTNGAPCTAWGMLTPSTVG